MVLPYYALTGRGWMALIAKCDGLRGLHAMIKERRDVPRKVPDGQVIRYINMWAGPKRA